MESIARIIAVHKERYALYDEEKGEFYAKLKASNFYYNSGAVYPVTGDLVKYNYIETGDSLILETCPRKTVIERFDGWSANHAQAIAANVDEAFIMTSANHDFNLKRIHRYLSVCRQGKVHCTIVITKADVAADVEAFVDQVRQDMPDVDVIPISAYTGYGVKKIEENMQPGTVSVFLGSSGVGKSTLVNRLAGRQVMDVNGIREDDSKGRHTTTHRQMIYLDNDAMVIDVPGMREMGLLDAEEGLKQTFKTVADYEGMCRFSDCTHGNEPGCAVRAAIENGELSENALREYKNLQGEAKRLKREKSIMVSKHRKELKNSPKRKH